MRVSFFILCQIATTVSAFLSGNGNCNNNIQHDCNVLWRKSVDSSTRPTFRLRSSEVDTDNYMDELINPCVIKVSRFCGLQKNIFVDSKKSNFDLGENKFLIEFLTFFCLYRC